MDEIAYRQRLDLQLRALANRIRKLEVEAVRLDRRVDFALAAIPRAQRFIQSIGPLVIGSVDVTVTWPAPWADDTYLVAPEVATGTAALGAVHATLKIGTRTETGCVITVASVAAVAVAVLDVLGIRP